MEVEISRFGYLLGTLLHAGLPATQALDSLHVATDFPQYKKLYGHLRNSVEEGNSIQKSFATYPGSRSLVPLSIVRLIGAGEQSGNLSEVLLRISETYEQKTETTAKNLTVLLEPILLVVVWGGVVMVALAVILPIYNLIGGFNDGARQQPQPTPQAIEIPLQTAVPAIDERVDVGVTTSVETEASPQQETAATESSSDTQERIGESSLGTLTVLKTDLGYLNVREEPRATSEKVTEVLPGDTFSYVEEGSGWYKILLSNGSVGWVSATYVEVTPHGTDVQ